MEEIAACARQLDALADEYKGNPRGGDAVSIFLGNHNVEHNGAMYVAKARTAMIRHLPLPVVATAAACWVDGFSVGLLVGRDTQ